jgi:hypothetical protein
VAVDPALLAFAEDPDEYTALGPDEERIVIDRFIVMFSPGEHHWSTTVGRVRAGDGGVRGAVDAVRDLMRERGRRAAAWTIGPSATPPRLRERLIDGGLTLESEEGSTILVLDDPPIVRTGPFDVRRVSTFEDHIAAIEVAIEGFGFSEADADHERRRARDTFDAERTGGHVIRFLALDSDRPVSTGYCCPSPHGLYLGSRRSPRTAVAERWERSSRVRGRKRSSGTRRRWSCTAARCHGLRSCGSASEPSGASTTSSTGSINRA